MIQIRHRRSCPIRSASIEVLLTSAGVRVNRFDNDGDNSLSEHSGALALDHQHGQMKGAPELEDSLPGALGNVPVGCFGNMQSRGDKVPCFQALACNRLLPVVGQLVF